MHVHDASDHVSPPGAQRAGNGSGGGSLAMLKRNALHGACRKRFPADAMEPGLQGGFERHGKAMVGVLARGRAQPRRWRSTAREEGSAP